MRLFFKIFLYFSLAVILCLTGFYFYIFHFGGLEKIVNDKISQLVDSKYLVSININKIKGSFFSQIILEDVDIQYNDPTYSYQLLKIPRISTAYSFSNLWNKKYLFDFLTIESAELTLVQDSAKKWVIPDFRPNEQSDAPALSLPSFTIGALNIQNMSVKLLKGDDTVKFENIFLGLQFQGEENTYAFDIEKFIFSSNQKNLSLNAAGGKVTYAEKRLIFQDVALVTAETRFKVDGNILLSGEPAGELNFAVDDIDLENISRYLGPKLKGHLDLNGSISFVGKSLEGSVNIGGDFLFMNLHNVFVDFRYSDKQIHIDTLYGTVFDDCDIDGNGFVDFSTKPEKYGLKAEVRQFNLKNILPNSFYSNITGNVAFQGESFKSESLKLEFKTDVYESFFDEYPLQAAVGEFVVTKDAITFLDSFRVEYFENIFYVNGKVDYDSTMKLDVVAQLNNLDRYRSKLFIDQPGGRGYAEAIIEGKTNDPDLQGFFSSDSVWIYGLYADTMYALFDIERFLSRKKGMVELDMFEGSAWNVPYQSAYSFLTVDSNLVYIDSVAFENEFTMISSKGLFDHEAVPNTLQLDTLYLNFANQSFYNRDDIKIDIDSLGFTFKKASIGNFGQWLAVDGKAYYNESLDLLLSVNNIPIEPWKNLYEDSINVSGILSCEASLTGKFYEPEFTIKANLDSLAYKGLVLGDLDLRVSYDDQKLTLDTVYLYSAPGIYSASGYLYADLSFTSDSVDRFPDRPMSIKCTGKDSRFELITFLLPSVEVVNGDFFADILISGSPQQPHLEGEAYIKSYKDPTTGKIVPANLKYFDLEAPIYTDSAGVTMTNNFIRIDKITTYIFDKKQKKYANISGNITVKTFDNLFYDLTVDIPKAIPFKYELDDISGRAKGKLQVYGETPPTVSGDIEIQNMKYDVNFADETEGSIIMQFLLAGENTWNLDIDIVIPSNYWIQNEDIDAEFAGDLNLKRTNGQYQFAGELEILRGKGYLFDKTIRLDPGGAVIFEGDDKFNPTLDITGYTRLTGSKDNLDESNTTEQLKLGLRITGTLEEPVINVTEDSDFGSNESILPLLVANYSGGSTAVSSSFEERVAGLLSTYGSQIGTKQLRSIGVETFEINPQTNTEGQLDPNLTRVTLGKYWGSNFYTYGTVGTSRFDVGFEYRFNRTLMLQGLPDEDGFYHLNLKWNKEFDEIF